MACGDYSFHDKGEAPILLPQGVLRQMPSRTAVQFVSIRAKSDAERYEAERQNQEVVGVLTLTFGRLWRPYRQVD
jgi:hypothetical protein